VLLNRPTGLFADSPIICFLSSQDYDFDLGSLADFGKIFDYLTKMLSVRFFVI